MSPPILNTIGLVLTVCGCALLYQFGLPAQVNPSGTIHLIIEQRDEAEIKKGKRYRWMGRLGFVLIGIGALFQIAANWAH